MVRVVFLHVLTHRTTVTAAEAAQPLSAFRCLMTSSNSETPATGIQWRGFCRHFSSKAVGSEFIDKDLTNMDSSVLVMERKERLDPFSLVADELSLISTRLRKMVAAEVPKLASATEYFFKIGVEGKMFRPTVLLLMATALNVASLLHDDVLDDADTRRGVGSLNAVMGNKLAVLAGNFLLSRACQTLATLKNTKVVTLIATIFSNLVTGETMQLTTAPNQRFSMEYYMQKTYNKTASLMSNSCKSVAILAGHTTEVAMLAFEYGKNLGLAFQLIDDVLDFTGTSASLGKGSLSDIRHGIITAPILFAMEEFPELRAVVDKGFDNPSNVDIALEYLGKSKGIERSKELAMKHANLAALAIDSLPQSDDEDVIKSRQALVDLTQKVITRNK